MTTQEALEELDGMHRQIIHGPTIFKDIADVIRNQLENPNTDRGAVPPPSACSDLELARMLIAHAVDSMLTTCGNSYVNAYTEQWLDWAQRLGAYHGPVIGNCKAVSEKWEQWLAENGGLPEWPDSPHWLKRMG